jgi:acyl CoA:acetate/3-ketoacid CoA transferase beta subunit
MGGGSDLALRVKKVIVTMLFTTKEGLQRIKRNLIIPLLPEPVDMLVTYLAVIDIIEHGLILKEITTGWT